MCIAIVVALAILHYLHMFVMNSMQRSVWCMAKLANRIIHFLKLSMVPKLSV